MNLIATRKRKTLPPPEVGGYFPSIHSLAVSVAATQRDAWGNNLFHSRLESDYLRNWIWQKFLVRSQSDRIVRLHLRLSIGTK